MALSKLQKPKRSRRRHCLTGDAAFFELIGHGENPVAETRKYWQLCTYTSPAETNQETQLHHAHWRVMLIYHLSEMFSVSTQCEPAMLNGSYHSSMAGSRT